MSGAQLETVVAGSKAFAVALLAPMSARLGARPRVSGDAGQVLRLCTGPSALAVVEFTGEGSLTAIQALVRDGQGLRVVAALSAVHAAAENTLQALGVEVGYWNGKVDGVLAAVDRALAAAARAAEEAASVPAEGGDGLVELKLAPAPAPAPAPARFRPPHVPAAPPVLSRAPRLTPAPLPAAAAPVPAVPIPAAPVPAVPGPIAAPASSAAPLPSPEPAPSAAGRSVKLSAVSVLARGGGTPVPESDWPATGCSAADAQVALERAFDERGDPFLPLDGLAAKVLAKLSDLEKASLLGHPLPFDPDPIRKASVMRLRVAEALATAPAPGGRVDSAAMGAMLAEMDGILALVGLLPSSAPPEVAPALEAIRNSLVREAIDFSEAAQRILPAGARAPAPARPAAPATRLRSTPVEVEDPRGAARRRLLPIAMGVVLAAAAAYHGLRYLAAHDALQQPGPPGIPDNMVAAGGARSPLALVPHGPVDRSQLEAFKARKEQEGKQVLERNGTIIVLPASGGEKKAPPP